MRQGGGDPGFPSDADAAVAQLGLAVVPGTEVDRLHIHLGRSRRRCQQIGRRIDHGDRADWIDAVSGTRLTLIGDQQLLAVGTELHHVGQGAHGDDAEQGRKGGIGQVIELNRSRICFDGVLNRNCEQISEDRHALEGFTDDVGGAASHSHRAGRIAQIADSKGTRSATYRVQVARFSAVSGDFRIRVNTCERENTPNCNCGRVKNTED